MDYYFLTAFHPSGETLINERIEAESEEKAKKNRGINIKGKEPLQPYPPFGKCFWKIDIISQIIWKSRLQ